MFVEYLFFPMCIKIIDKPLESAAWNDAISKLHLLVFLVKIKTQT